MAASENVHKAEGPRRIARGIRMDAAVWSDVDDLAELLTNGNASALLEKWAREKIAAVREAA